MRAVVVGCGIGGVPAALAPAEIGVSVEVYEAAQRSADRGGWVTLGPAAMTGLDRVGVADDVWAVGIALLKGIGGLMRVSTDRFSWSLACVATYATATSAWITWFPRGNPNDLQYGWSTRLGDWVTIAIGNYAEVVALGEGARVLGALFVAAAAFLPVAVVLVAIRWADLRYSRWPPRQAMI
ncbi:MAG: hypothetical protein ACRDRS_05985 [Pseudonocardiaceae bacterium]